MRNKLGGHGQGSQVVPVPPHYAVYVLHMTGSAIQFLIEAEKNLPSVSRRATWYSTRGFQ